MATDTRTLARDRDRGAALILVLLLIVIAGLITVPMARYATSVLRANEVVSTRRIQAEAAKGGFRYAMADPQVLYDVCREEVAGPNNPADLDEPPGLALATETSCYQLEEHPAIETADLPESLATTYVGMTPPFPVGTYYVGSGDPNPSRWITDSSPTQQAGSVFLPDLPVHAFSLRAASGFQMPAGYPLNGYTECTVYFPGTYKSDLVLDGPTYFTSGVYYFENEIKLVGGADVVLGYGNNEGCADDQYSVFYATNAPTTHNISGAGVTFVLGDDARLVVDNSAGPVSFKMNQRYVQTNDHGGASSARVSIMTVNGDLNEALETTDFPHSGVDLELPGAPDSPMLRVPLSYVPCQPNASDVPDCADNEDDARGKRPAPKDGYHPSTLVPEPHPPTEPLNVRNGAGGDRVFSGAVLVTWDAPELDGGKPITQYSVTSNGTSVCTTTGRRSCLATGLTNGNNYTFQVTATNDVGSSPPSAASLAIKPLASAAAPAALLAPGNVRITQDSPPVAGESLYNDTLEVSWDAPVDATVSATSNAAPADSYHVVITDLETLLVSECTAVDVTTCVFQDLPLADPARLPTPYLAQYRVEVTATSVTGPSVTSESAVATLAQVNLPPADGKDYLPLPDVLHLPYTPPPVVDVTMASNNAVTFLVPGYVSVPQGVVRVSLASGADPANKQVRLDGGVLAAWMLISEQQASVFAMGLQNPMVQRVIRVQTTVPGSDVTSVAIVQINESGGWAVNSWVVQ